MGNPEKLTT